jgi:hypothetical protein
MASCRILSLIHLTGNANDAQSIKVQTNLPFPIPLTGINFFMTFININTILRALWIQPVANPAHWITPEAAWVIYTSLTWIAVVSSKSAFIFIYNEQ